MQGQISGLISLNCMSERSCYTDRCIQEVLRFALHLKSSFWYKNSASDSNLNVVHQIRMHGSAHRLLGYQAEQAQSKCGWISALQSSGLRVGVKNLLFFFLIDKL